MAALVVVTVSPANGMSGERRAESGSSREERRRRCTRPKRRSGWATASRPTRRAARGLDEATTRFELDVDGEPVSMLTDVHSDAGLPVRKTNIAEFPDGLPAGWHDFTGRWYDGGRLILSSRAAIQFVER